MSTQIEDTDAEALPEFWAKWNGSHVVLRVPGPTDHGDDPDIGTQHHLDIVTACKLFAQLGVACRSASEDPDGP